MIMKCVGISTGLIQWASSALAGDGLVSCFWKASGLWRIPVVNETSKPYLERGATDARVIMEPLIRD